MASMIFRYRDRDSFLNRLNPNIKILSLLAVCISLTHPSVCGFVILTSLVIAAAVSIRLPIWQYVRELVFFFIIGLLIGVTEYSQTHSITETTIKVISFMMMILSSLILADTTDLQDMARSMGSLLDHIPFVNGWVISSHIELTLSCIPLVFDIGTSVREARMSRNERTLIHPFRSMVGFTVTLFDNLLVKIGEVADSLDARMFDPSKPRKSLPYHRRDIFMAIFMTMAVAASEIL